MSTQFKKDLKTFNNPKIVAEIRKIIESLSNRQKLSTRHKDHNLSGELKEYRECHIKPDLLLIYRVDSEYLYLARLGSHSKLFK